MPATSVAGGVFTVDLDNNGYEEQVTSGTVTLTPVITRTKTLSGVNFKQTDNNAGIELSFLYDENNGMYDALASASSSGSDVAVDVRSVSGHWAGASMYIESLEMSVDAAGVATATVSFTGNVTFS